MCGVCTVRARARVCVYVRVTPAHALYCTRVAPTVCSSGVQRPTGLKMLAGVLPSESWQVSRHRFGVYPCPALMALLASTLKLTESMACIGKTGNNLGKGFSKF